MLRAGDSWKGEGGKYFSFLASGGESTAEEGQAARGGGWGGVTL
jgi:hypothetical protein